LSADMAGKFRAIFGNLINSLHQLWLEVTGALLLVFAAIFGYYAFKEYRSFPETTDNIWGIVASAGLSLLTLSFGLHSFWKSRKLR